MHHEAVLLFVFSLSELRHRVTSSANEANIVCEIWGFHEGQDFGCDLPGCDTVQSVSHLSCSERTYCLHHRSGGSRFLRNIYKHIPD